MADNLGSVLLPMPLPTHKALRAAQAALNALIVRAERIAA